MFVESLYNIIPGDSLTQGTSEFLVHALIMKVPMYIERHIKSLSLVTNQQDQFHSF